MDKTEENWEEKEYNTEEWLKDMMFVVGKLSRENWVALLVLIEGKVRYETRSTISKVLEEVREGMNREVEKAGNMEGEYQDAGRAMLAVVDFAKADSILDTIIKKYK